LAPKLIASDQRSGSERQSLSLTLSLTVSLTLSQPNAKPGARAKKYLAVVRNYYSTKTTHLQAEHKYTTKANLCIRVQMSDDSMFRYNGLVLLSVRAILTNGSFLGYCQYGSVLPNITAVYASIYHTIHTI